MSTIPCKNKGKERKIYILSILFVILVIGILLRIHALGRYSLWFDEAMSVLQARNLKAILIEKDNTPPLYLFLLHYWDQITDTEFGLRLLSVLFSSISILMTYLLGKLLFTKKIGLISAFLLAISPLNIYYSQELRMYSMMTCLTLFSVYFLIRALKDQKFGFWMGYVIFNLLNIYCHYMSLFIWLAQGFFFLMVYYRDSGKKIREGWFVSNFLIFFCSIPWLMLTFYPTIEMAKTFPIRWNFFWTPPISFKSLFMSFKNFSSGYNATAIVYLFTTTIFFLFFILGIFKMRKQKKLLLCLLCLFVPILALAIISSIRSIYIDRYLVSSSLFYYLIVSAGLSTINKKGMTLSLLFICILSMTSLRNQYNNFLTFSFEEHVGIYKKKDHRAIAEYISKGYQKGDVVYHTCRNTTVPFIYYFDKFYNNVFATELTGICLSLIEETNTLKTSGFDIYGRKIGGVFDGSNRIWLILSSWDFYRDKSRIGKELSLVDWLDRHHRKISSKSFDGAIVYLYEKSDG